MSIARAGNRYKATRQTAIDPNTQEEVKLFHPQQQLWIDHFTWSEDATEIVGLTSVGRSTISALKMNRPQLTCVRKMWVKMAEMEAHNQVEKVQREKLKTP